MKQQNQTKSNNRPKKPTHNQHTNKQHQKTKPEKTIVKREA